MSMENKEEIFESVRHAVGEDGDLRERVRALVMNALVHRQAEPQAIKEVMRDAVAGLDAGLAGHADKVGKSLEAAVRGLDEALGKAIHALQMAAEESWSDGRRFAETDLRDAYDAIRDLEDDLIATLRQTGDRTQGTLKDEFARLGEHLSRTGTDTGSQIRETLSILGRGLGQTAGGAARDVGTNAREATGRLSAVASGILRGMADALDRSRE